MKKKTFVIALCLALVVAFAAGGAIAWLTDTTDSVTNTFTVGNIDISLAETTTDFKMIPGNTIAKDPKVTVKAGSEACWLFVKIEESDNLDTYISYTVASGWTQLTGVDGVYYRSVAAVTADTDFAVLTGNAVTVNGTVTKADMDAITNGTATAPTLTFTAYAVQSANVATAADAWAKIG
ncbi:MAG: TasA family protein [Candidatus Aphodomorpha sp.]